ncbi:uncharacterized protein YjbI with pentapeptide repeats [Variovorax paradoxus]|uniref:DUF2169 family type VI secretion system accessory protein n=1 Tax=Variovorax paradoxus TaxID=34073 RepID=UPI00277D7686|nr:DUF2169 domain-containing protein [Variovorax paradoxus]MDP9963932.1 uncharacterized protein YjbI with pentapeptide repeats [Variovorax paradoxus]
MKIVKPFRLSILSRPYRWQQKDVLGISVIAMIGLGDDPQLLSEQELWEMVAEEIGAGAVFDLGVPKGEPEFLVSGHAYTAHQTEKSACAVRIRVADLEKSLTVFGDRYWLGGKSTDAQPFDSMPVDWSRAYGGPGVAENPLGIGTVDEVVNGISTRRLPNVEDPRHRITKRDQHAIAAGLGGIPPDWPQRMRLMGTRYGADWLQNGFPGFAEDMDWRYFNAAPADQRWHARQEFPPGAAYEIMNMHPEIPAMRGRLPDWQARCFSSFRKDGADLQETALRLTTAWFFPHRERAALVWHGTLAIGEDDASDVKHMMPVLELRNEPRPLKHYQDVLLKRLDPENNPGHLLRDSDLAPKSILGAWKAAQIPDVLNRPMPRNLQAGRLRDYEARRLELIAEGLDPEQYIARPSQAEQLPELDELPEFLERMEQQIAQARRKAEDADEDKKRLDDLGEKMAREAGVESQNPTSTHVDPDEQIRQLDRFDELPPLADDATATALSDRKDLKERLSTQIREGYLYSAHLSGRAPPLTSFRAAKIRRRLEAQPGERNFSGLNLIGADLSGMDLRGANFSGATLTDANLDGALLDDCDFSRAVLVRANMARASSIRGRFESANLAGALLDETVLSHAQFRDANCQRIHFRKCKLDGATLERVDFQQSVFTLCDMRGCEWQQMSLLRLTLEDIAFDEATLSQSVWLECRLLRVSFAGAKLTRCAFVSTDCSQAVNYAGATLEACAFAQDTSLVSVSFRGALLKQCSLRGCDLTGADLNDARLDTSDLSECILRTAQLDRAVGGESLFIRADFTGASMRRANLIDANLSKAILSLADLSGANLFRADVSQALVDATTTLEGAYTRGAKIWPARRTKGAA